MSYTNDRKLKLFQSQLVRECDLYQYLPDGDYDAIVPNRRFWHDGCLQEKFYVGNLHYCTNFTAPSYFIYRIGRLPPKSLQYPGWEKQQIIYEKFNKLTMPQFWVVCTKKAVPKQLQIDGWKEQKFVYKILFGMDQTEDNDSDFICLYGTMKDAYKYYGIISNINDDIDEYKISDNVDDVLQLSELIHESIFIEILTFIIKQELKTKNYKFINSKCEFKKLIEKHIVTIYKALDYSLPDILKFDGWQKAQENTNTIFSTELQHRFYKQCPDILPPAEMWFDGCKQQKFYDTTTTNIKQKSENLFMTPAQFIAYRTQQLPPKELLYDGWEKEPITYNGKDTLFAHFYLMYNRKAIPKFLQCDGWDTKKFLYGVVKDVICKYERIVKFYGTVKDAYKFYTIADLSEEACEKHKISDKAQCTICYQQKPVYNFCEQHHNDGICLECAGKLEKYKCPLCRKILVIAPEKIGSREFYNYGGSSDDE